MKILIIILLIPFFCFSQYRDSTEIKIINSEFDSLIMEGKSELVIRFYAPDSKPATRKNIVLIIGNDTICYNTDSVVNDVFLVNAGYQLIQIYSKWWHETKEEIILKSQNRIFLEIYFSAKPFQIPNINYNFDKPVIYIYSDKKQKVDIELDFQGEIKFSYPKYESGWSFITDVDGVLEKGEKKFRYLFWDGEIAFKDLNIDILSEGFIVASDSLVDFFHMNLSKIGLTSIEQQDFITYWVPQMISNKQNFIQFVFNEEYDSIVQLKIIPKPDNLIRLFMFWMEVPLNKNIEVKKQEIPKYSRDGFSVIEWGGSKIPLNYVDFSIVKK